MKKTNRFNAPELGEVKFIHPLRLEGDDLKNSNWRAGPVPEQYAPALTEKLAQFNLLTNQHLPNYPDMNDPKCIFLNQIIGNDFAKLAGIKWRLMRNTSRCVHAFATISFNSSEEASLTLTESFAQYFTEALNCFGARYGRSLKSWVLYLPNFESIPFEELQVEFVKQVQLSWTRLSNVFQKYTLQTVITPDVLLGQDNSNQEQSNFNYKPAFFFHKKQPINLFDVLGAINKMTDPVQKLNALEVGKLGSIVDVKPENSSARQSLLKSLLLLEYLSREKVPHIFYSEIMHDSHIHLSLKLHAKELLEKRALIFTKKPMVQMATDSVSVDSEIEALNISARDPRFILIVNLDINTEYPVLNTKLDEAVNASKVEQNLFFRVTGSLNNLALEQVDSIQIYGDYSPDVNCEIGKSTL